MAIGSCARYSVLTMLFALVICIPEFSAAQGIPGLGEAMKAFQKIPMEFMQVPRQFMGMMNMPSSQQEPPKEAAQARSG
uniref:Putative secreted protein n=1 Tax=Rhipicephalus microplus TaxID=6941 RepID=A0A6G5A235_RHIMP